MLRAILRARAANAPRSQRQVVCLLALLSAVMLCLVASASARGVQQRSATATPFLLGIEDNAQILGNADAVLARHPGARPAGLPLHDLLVAGGQAAARERRGTPTTARTTGRTSKTRQGRSATLHIPVLLTIVSTPAWAGGGSKGLKAPKQHDRPAGLRVRGGQPLQRHARRRERRDAAEGRALGGLERAQPGRRTCCRSGRPSARRSMSAVRSASASRGCPRRRRSTAAS